MKFSIWVNLRNIFTNWSKDNVSRLSAALAYYTTFALTPVLVICISIAKFALGNDDVKHEIISEITHAVGKSSAEQIQAMIENVTVATSGTYATLISGIILIFASISLFSELRNGLNTIWGVQHSQEHGLVTILMEAILSFAMVFVVTSLLLFSFILSTLSLILQNYLSLFLSNVSIFLFTANLLASLALVTILFALIFKILPDVQIAWSEIWGCAFITAILFLIGKIFLEIYLSQTNVASAFGAASSLVAVLVWVYYSAQIFYIGAEFAKVTVLSKRIEKN